jgi:hypothetical protein
MQGKLIIGAFLIVALGSPSVAAVEQPQQRQLWAQQEQQQRNKPHGCPVNRTIPSVVDPTPTFLL